MRRCLGPKCQPYGLNGGGCSLEIFNFQCMSLVCVSVGGPQPTYLSFSLPQVPWEKCTKILPIP